MNRPRKPEKPKRFLVVQGYNGDHEVTIRLAKRPRYLLLAVAMAILLEAPMDLFSTVMELMDLFAGIGLVP